MKMSKSLITVALLFGGIFSSGVVQAQVTDTCYNSETGDHVQRVDCNPSSNVFNGGSHSTSTRLYSASISNNSDWGFTFGLGGIGYTGISKEKLTLQQRGVALRDLGDFAIRSNDSQATQMYLNTMSLHLSDLNVAFRTTGLGDDVSDYYVNLGSSSQTAEEWQTDLQNRYGLLLAARGDLDQQNVERLTDYITKRMVVAA